MPSEIATADPSMASGKVLSAAEFRAKVSLPFQIVQFEEDLTGDDEQMVSNWFEQNGIGLMYIRSKTEIVFSDAADVAQLVLILKIE